jgi:putative membrane protein
VLKTPFSWISVPTDIHEEMYESEETLMMWGYGLNWLNMTLMMLGSTLGMVLLVVLAWAVIRWLNQRTTRPTRQTHTLQGSGLTAREILRQRYARGEIDATTFEPMWERLEPSGNAPQGSWAEGQRPAGESLFDGRTTHGSEIVRES